MGGTNEKTINGLRMHVNANQVHIHDDTRKLKYTQIASEFKKDMEGALRDLKGAEGVIILASSGSGDDLCVGCQGGVVFMNLIPHADIKTELDTFLKGV